MTETILSLVGMGVLMLAGVVVAVRQRRPAVTWRESELSAPLSIAGVFAGRGDYVRAHSHELQIVQACELASARGSGRWLGDPVTVEWTPGRDEEIDQIYIPWLRRHGPPNQVFIQERR